MSQLAEQNENEMICKLADWKSLEVIKLYILQISSSSTPAVIIVIIIANDIGYDVSLLLDDDYCVVRVSGSRIFSYIWEPKESMRSN